MTNPKSGEQTVNDEVLAELADDFINRHRRGEGPSMEQYAENHPALANQIRDLFPALLVMEQQSTPDWTLDSS